MKKLIFIGVIIMLFTPNATHAQDTLSKADFIKAVFKAALLSSNPDTLSGDLYQIQVDSTTILWSESFGYGKVWLKGDSSGFTFRFRGNDWVFILNDAVQQKLEALDEAYVIQVIRKIKNKK